MNNELAHRKAMEVVEEINKYIVRRKKANSFEKKRELSNRIHNLKHDLRLYCKFRGINYGKYLSVIDTY